MKKLCLLFFAGTAIVTLKPMVKDSQHNDKRLVLIQSLKKEACELFEQNQHTKAQERFATAAALGDAEAQYIIANIYVANGSLSEAVTFFFLSAQQNYEPAIAALANLNNVPPGSASSVKSSSTQLKKSPKLYDDNDVDDKIS